MSGRDSRDHLSAPIAGSDRWPGHVDAVDHDCATSNGNPGHWQWGLSALLILSLISIGVFAFLVDAEFSLTGKPTVDLLLLAAVANLLIYIYVRVVVQVAAKRQFAAIAALVVLQLAAVAAIQVEGIYGNGRPIFNWRWAALPADRYPPAAEPRKLQNGTASLPTVGVWPAFRGPEGLGITSEFVGDWSVHPPELLWRKQIGAGWASFTVVGEFAFTMEQRGPSECVTCYDIKTGKEVWVHQDAERFREISGGEGPRATPTFVEGFLYTYGATGVLNCLDARNGDILWSVDVLRAHNATNCYFGMCNSPLVVGDHVIVPAGGKGASLVAYSRFNGELIWKAGDAEASYATPTLVEIDGVKQVLNFNAEGLTSHRLDSGVVLWHFPWISNEAERNNVCQPILVAPNHVFLSSGYGRGSALLNVTRTESGFELEPIWKSKGLKSKFASAVLVGEHIFGLDEGIMVCLDLKTGRRVWKAGRYRHGQLLIAADFVVVQAEAGYLALVEKSSEGFREIHRLPALQDRTWTHPVVANGYLLTRNDREMACFRLPSK